MVCVSTSANHVYRSVHYLFLRNFTTHIHIIHHHTFSLELKYSFFATGIPIYIVLVFVSIVLRVTNIVSYPYLNFLDYMIFFITILFIFFVSLLLQYAPK